MTRQEIEQKMDELTREYHAQREYAAAREQIEALERATDKRYRKLKRSRKFVTVSAEQLRKMLE
jgi:hypothetical protein